MQRWHGSSCSQPDIEILSDKIPRCRSCDGRPDIAGLIVSSASASSSGNIPPDKPFGELGLWWPRSVPYSPCRNASPSTVESAQSQASNNVEVGGKDTVGPCMPSHIYSDALGPNEFRLICASAVSNPDYPVHLELESYDLDECPEYEAVSYTWGGENDDSSPCQPVYVGPFWDILLQSQNCWDMLRFTRPWRGIRMLWVDAICIDQHNIAERNAQVAQMGKIYSQCSRVIVYLGSDLAFPLHGKHPRRRMLYELDSQPVLSSTPTPIESSTLGEATVSNPAPATTSELAAIIKRRYFSRVWVVQELLLSQRAVMRVGSTDYWIDAGILSRFDSYLSNWDWEKSQAAWMQLVSKGASSSNHISKLMELTARSSASDPRDRIFALLAVSPPHTKTHSLLADYSLSSQHVFVGLSAYIIFVEKRPMILYQASGLSSALPNYPTWVPAWNLPIASEDSPNPPSLSHGSPGGFRSWLRKKKEPILWQLGLSPFSVFNIHQPVDDSPISMTRPWHHDAFVDQSSGALHVNLTHFMTLSKPPQAIGTFRTLLVYSVAARTCTIYLTSRHQLDDCLADSDKYQIFVMNVDHKIMYLVLRPSLDEGNSTFKLIAVCADVYIETSRVVRRQHARRRSAEPTKGPKPTPLNLRDLQQSVYDAIESLKQVLQKDIYLDEVSRDYTMRLIIPGAAKFATALPILIWLHADMHKSVDSLTEGFEGRYIACVDPRYAPRVSDGFIEMKLSLDWQAVLRDKLPRGALEVRKAVDEGYEQVSDRSNDLGGWRMSSSIRRNRRRPWDEEPDEKSHGASDIRFPVSSLMTTLREDKGSHTKQIMAIMDRLHHACKRLGRHTWSFLEEVLQPEAPAPEESFKFVGCPHVNDINQEVWEELETSGSTYMVSIQ